MVRGRNTTKLSIRLPDDLIVELRKRADRLGIPYSTLIRHYLQEKCGMPLS